MHLVRGPITVVLGTFTLEAYQILLTGTYSNVENAIGRNLGKYA